jgi:hypothetical protein
MGKGQSSQKGSALLCNNILAQSGVAGMIEARLLDGASTAVAALPPLSAMDFIGGTE